MLTGLSIKNYALIEELQVDFSNGLSTITGETGAGKSILLGGLSLVLGKRADLSQIKDNAKKCIIEAVFDIANYDLKTIFEKEDLDYDPQTIIRREILPSGKSRAFVNDTPVNLESLSAISSYLIDIHSQHQTLELVDDTFQFTVIDALAENSLYLENYSKTLREYKDTKQKLSELEASRADAVKEYDYTLFLLNELNEANLKEGELEELEALYEQLNNMEQISEVLSFSKAQLNADDIGTLEQLNAIKRQLGSISGFGKAYFALEERINSVSIELDDIIEELDALENQLVSDPTELERVSSKLQVINNLLHKHSVQSVQDLLKIKERLDNSISSTEHLDENIVHLKAKVEELVLNLRQIASKLHKSRKAKVPTFIKTLESILADLGMPNAKFKIGFKQTDIFKSNGMDDLEFLFMANKGSQFTELKRSASGGELSRIMLAIKSILVNYIKLPTIIFDEIDTGVSGEISHKMGEIMTIMSRRMQVLAITHLPQIASKGDRHYKVYKIEDGNSTETQIKVLSQDQRIVEIAQMLGGTDVTDSAIAHAKQLLN